MKTLETDLVRLLSPVWKVKRRKSSADSYANYKWVIRVKDLIHDKEIIFYFEELPIPLGHDIEHHAKENFKLIYKETDVSLLEILKEIHKRMSAWNPKN